MLYARLFSRPLFVLPPESAHRVALSGLHLAHRVGLGRALARAFTPGDEHRVEALGLRFRNPIGLAAGFDKNARHVRVLPSLGFGFLEVGSVTARPTPGNPTPRLFRLAADRALVNRMGLGNEGAEHVARRLENHRSASRTGAVPLFVNVALTPGLDLDTDGAVEDYVTSVRHVREVADAIVLNVSCPNTGDGRTFEDARLLDRLLGRVREVHPPGGRPLLVKLSSDATRDELAEAVETALEHDIDGLVATNTTIDRTALTKTNPARLAAIGGGGLSGRPLLPRALSTVSAIRGIVGPKLPIVGVGGIDSGASARAFLDAGATLVELYTGLVYEGPSLVRRISGALEPPTRATSEVTRNPATTSPSAPAS